MAFNRNSTADKVALRNEVRNDPTGQGYSDAERTSEVLELLNNPDLNVSADVIDRPVDELIIPQIAGVIDGDEYSTLTEYDKEWVRMFISQPAEADLLLFQDKFLLLFPNGSKTRAAAFALRQKPASRAEVLFGVNTVISKEDWFAGRDS